MDLLKGLPGPVRELLPYLSPRALQVVELTGMASAMGRLGRQWLLGTGSKQAHEALSRCLPPGVALGRVNGALAVDELSIELRKQLGERLLSLYFRQIFSDAPLFFDLRPTRLSWDADGITWDATKAFYALDHGFRRSLQGLYQGYYGNDLPRLKKSLRELKLVAEDASAEAEAEVVDLLLSHFSGGREGTVRFSMATFKESFDSLFGLVLATGNRLAPDFAFVGLLLASLYLSLEALDVELEVSPQYLEAVRGFRQ